MFEGHSDMSALLTEQEKRVGPTGAAERLLLRMILGEMRAIRMQNDELLKQNASVKSAVERLQQDVQWHGK